MDLVLVANLLDGHPCSTPFIQGAGPAQSLAWHFLCLTCQDSLERDSVSPPHHHPVQVGQVKLCWNCDSFVLQTLDHTKFNQVQIHLVAVKLIYEGTVREGICCAKGTVSAWLVILERNQLLLFLPAPLSALLLLGPISYQWGRALLGKKKCFPLWKHIGFVFSTT